MVGKYLYSQEALGGKLDSDGLRPGRGGRMKEEVIHTVGLGGQRGKWVKWRLRRGEIVK